MAAGAKSLDMRRPGWSRRGLLLAFALVGGGSTALVARVDGPTSYASASAWGAIATLAAGLGLLAAGTVTAGLAEAHSARSPLWRTAGLLAALAGLAWLAPVWVGWWEGPPLARSVGMVVAPFLLPLLMHLVVVVGDGRSRSVSGRVLLMTTYAVTSAVATVQALVRHPIQDLHCWSNCTENVFLWRPLPQVARAVGTGWLWFALAVAILTAIYGTSRMAASTATARSRVGPVLMPAVLAVVAEGLYAALLLIDPAEDPADPRFAAVFLLRAIALAALAIGLMWVAERVRRRRTGVERLVEALDTGADPVPTTLARTLGDPGLRVAYRLEVGDRYVDATGHPVDVGSAAAVTYVERGGNRVAVLMHETPSEDWHVGELGAAARLAIDNERLRAEVLAQLADLRASRARVVAAADESRARLERDLHDGTQQTLISLLFELRLALADAQQRDDPRMERLAEAVGEAERCVSDLRDLAHGVFPAVLDESGLATALWSLTDQAGVPVDVTAMTEARFPAVVERTAYALVRGVVDEATRHGSTGLALAVHHDGHALVVEIDGAPGHDDVHLADRVGAAGGDLGRTGERLRAVIPCA